MKPSIRVLTEARVALGRSGASMPTAQHLAMLEAQALARDSLWRVWDPGPLATTLNERGFPACSVSSNTQTREQYLRRPDLGRTLPQDSVQALQSWVAAQEVDCEVVLCITDGLASDAVARHMLPFLDCFLPLLAEQPFYRGKPYPVVLTPLARVAAADVVASALGSRLSVIFVGERPGLSAHDSLGIYLTYAPCVGLLDHRRNCISNVRPPGGLSYRAAAGQLLYLMRESLRLELSGIALKPLEPNLLP